jgi:hypothetical protein
MRVKNPLLWAEVKLLLDEIKEKIDCLVEKTEFLYKVETSEGPVLKINPNYSMYDLDQTIKALWFFLYNAHKYFWTLK